MIEAAVDGLQALLQWQAFGLMMIGIAIGLVVGILPGLGGVTALALMLPFIFHMEPAEAFAFLLGMFVVTSNTGELTSILFGVPGEATTAATIIDGHPMAKNGEAGRALGASLTSSAIGATIGVMVLALAIPIVRPLVLTFGSPELFALTLLGVTFIASLSGTSLIKGVVMGGLGFLLASVGASLQTGFLRYTFDQPYLFEGISLVPVALGLFALPEIFDLAVRGTSIAGRDAGKVGGVRQGVRDAFEHFWLVARCGGISAFIGMIPGLGSSAAQWLSYAHAVQSSPRKEEFGTGRVEGVLGPGASTNAKEGGALIPTLAFGVPGSLAMAILLGAFIIVGVTPGPDMLGPHLDVTFTILWVMVIANIISIAIAFLFLGQIARLTSVKGSILIPLLLVLVWVGSFSASNNFGDLIAVTIFGAMGIAVVKLDWPRPPLALGVVLGGLSDKYLYISSIRYGADFLTRPVVMVVLALAAGSLVFAVVQNRRLRAARAGMPTTASSWQGVVFTGLLVAVFVLALVTGRDWTFPNKIFPYAIAIPMLVLAVIQFGIEVKSLVSARSGLTPALAGAPGGPPVRPPRPGSPVVIEEPIEPRVARERSLKMTAWLAASFLLLWMIGLREGLAVFVFLYLRFSSKESWWLSALLTAIIWGLLFQFFGRILQFPWPIPLVSRWFDFNWPGV